MLKELLNSKSWQEALRAEFNKEYFSRLDSVLTKQMQEEVVFPPRELIFKAFEATSFEETRVVVLGQDPYFHAGEAMGLSFSLPQGSKLTPSLRNIFKEIERDTGEAMDYSNTDLAYLARQGVLLLNQTLTVEDGKPNSHSKLGWASFTQAVCSLLAARGGVAFLLWGREAGKLKSVIFEASGVTGVEVLNEPRLTPKMSKSNLILTAAHPSPLAHGGFAFCGHFSKTNAFLRALNQTAVKWGNANLLFV